MVKTITSTNLNQANQKFPLKLHDQLYTESNTSAFKAIGIGDEERLDFQVIDGYTGRMRHDDILVDVDSNKKFEEGYYMDGENKKKKA